MIRFSSLVCRVIKSVIISFFVFFLALGAMGQANPCKKSTEGTDFWFGFMESRNYNPQHYLEITVTAREATSFNITRGNSEVPFNNTYSVSSNSSVQIRIPWEDFEALGSESVQDKGIHLVSEKPVNVYALNWDANSADVAVIFPVESLGKEYFTICYQPNVHERSDGSYGNGRNSEFLVVATENSTEVKIVPSLTTDQLVKGGDTILVTLNKGEVYQVQSMNRNFLTGQGDLTGSYILSDKPVAVFSGSLATTIPSYGGTSAWDHLYEQIPPIQTWGREFYAVPLSSREQDRYIIMAAQDNTTIQITGRPDESRNRGGFWEVILEHDEPSRIYADKPIIVAQLSQSQSVDRSYTGGNGDPFMIVLSSTTQAKNDVTFVAYNSNQITRYFVNIVTLTSEVGNIRLNGNSIASDFVPFPEGEYSYAQKNISAGQYRIHNINKDRGFLAYVYGFGGVESYGYGVGFNLDLVLDLGESINFNGDTLLLCSGDTRTLDAGPYFDTYQWNTGDDEQKITVASGGKYSVKTTTIDGCALEDSIYIYVSDPKVDLGIDHDEGCFPYSIELDGNDGFAKYLWQDEAGDTLGTSQKLIADQTGEYRLSSFDKYNCVARDTMELTVFPVPEVKLQADTLLCGELSSQITALVSGTPESVWNYDGSVKWSTNKPSLLSFSDINNTSVQINATDWGNYEIYYELTTLDNCITGDTIKVQLQQQPTSLFKFEDDAKCEGYSKRLIFIGQATDSATFFWDLDGCKFVDTLGWQQYDISVGAFLEKPPFISLVINDNGCWSDTTILPLGAKPNFTMEADNLRGCDELTANFTSQLLTQDQVDFEWEFSDGSIVNSQNASKYFEKPGYYDVSLTITNPVTGCQNGFLLDSMVQVFPTPQASIIADPTFCYNDTMNLHYGAAIDSSICYWTFDGAWQLGDGNDSIQVFLDKQQGTIGLQVDEYGCLSDLVEIDLMRKPRVDFLSDNTDGCQPFSTEFSVNTEDSFLSYQWETLYEKDLLGESVMLSFPNSGKFDVALVASSSLTGCKTTLVKPEWIWVHPKPLASFEVDYPVALLENANISFFNHSEQADLFSWDFGDGSISSESDPAHTYRELGDFDAILIAESIYGCMDTSEFSIKILPFDVFTPNAFRPDSDIPENRTFMPVGLGADISRFKLKIFDRWGQLVFETNTPENPWEGTDKNGKAMPMGNYIWIANFYDIQGYEHNQKGQVLLVR